MSISVVTCCFDDDFQEYIRSHFQKKGYQLNHAQSVDEIAQLASTDNLDVLLLDVTQEQRGLTLIKQVQACCPQLRIVAMVRRDDVQTSIAAMKLGAFDDLGVPFDLADLDEKIEAAFQEKQRSFHKGPWSHLRQRIENYFAAAGLADQGAPDAARSLMARSRMDSRNHAKQKAPFGSSTNDKKRKRRSGE